MIIMDRGVVEDHMPNHVLESLLRFKKQCIMPHYDQRTVDKLRTKREVARKERREARDQTSVTGLYSYIPCIYSTGTTHYLPS